MNRQVNGDTQQLSTRLGLKLESLWFAASSEMFPARIVLCYTLLGKQGMESDLSQSHSPSHEVTAPSLHGVGATGMHMTGFSSWTANCGGSRCAIWRESAQGICSRPRLW
jgi:hypothetical protein